MEKTVFNNSNFYYTLIIGIGLLICWNFYAFINSYNATSFIRVILPLIILILIITKNKYAKTGIYILSIITIISAGLSIFAKTMKIALGDDISEMIYVLIIKLISLFVGLIIYHYNKTTVEIEKTIKTD